MVRITTAAKAIAPTPGSIVTIAPNCTSATRIDSMKMSIIDQRPIQSMMRYSTVRSRSRPVAAAPCTLISSMVRPTSFSTGTHDRGEEHQRRERPHAGIEQFAHAAEDGAGLAGAELDHGQHRIDVGRDIQDRAAIRSAQVRVDAVRLARDAAGSRSAGSARPATGRG